MARHALLVGVHAFEDARIHPLNAPDADVRAFSAVLRDPELGGFDQVELSVNEPYASIRSKIARLTANRAPDDLVLLYYSGHGVLDFDGGLHLLAANSSLDLLHEATFHSDEIKGFLDRSRSRRQVLVLDCCHAGAFVPPGHKDAGRREAVTSATFDPRGYGRVVILASSETQVVPDGTAAPEAISPFTRLLLEGLRDGEAAPEAEEISAQALAIYAETRMKRDFSGVTPRVIQDNQAGPIILARNPNAGVSRIPAEVRVALADPDWLRRGGALAHLSGLLDAGEPRVRQAARHLLQLRVGNERDIELRESLRVALEGRTLLAVEQELALCKRSCAEMRAAAVKQEHVLAARSKQIESLERELKEAKRNGAAAARLASSLRSEVAALKEAEAAAEVSTAELRKKLADTEKVLADTRGKLKQSNAELNASKAELLSGKLALLQKSVDSGEWKGLGADFLKTQHGKKLAERQGGEPTTPLKLTTQTESAAVKDAVSPTPANFDYVSPLYWSLPEFMRFKPDMSSDQIFRAISSAAADYPSLQLAATRLSISAGLQVRLPSDAGTVIAFYGQKDQGLGIILVFTDKAMFVRRSFLDMDSWHRVEYRTIKNGDSSLYLDFSGWLLTAVQQASIEEMKFLLNHIGAKLSGS